MSFSRIFSRSILFAFFLLGSVAQTFSCEGPNIGDTSGNHDNNKPDPVQPSLVAPPLVDVVEGYGESIQDMESCYENAPAEAKDIVARLKNPAPFARTYRFALMVSKPGDGKTLLSKAIAYKAGWKLAFFPSSVFAGTARNETLKNMLRILNWIVDSKIPTVVSIDEINRLAENTKSKNHDTQETAEALCNFFDAQKFNLLFYVIGTMNDITKIPKLFKQRAEGRIMYFKPLPLEVKRKILKGKITDVGWTFHQKDTDAILDQSIDLFLDNMLQEIPDWNARDMEAIANVAVTLALRAHNYQQVGSIEEQHFHGALEKIRLDREKSDYDREEESPEDREDRLRKKDRKLNKKENKKNRKQARKLDKDQAKRQELHQIQGLKSAVEVGANQVNASFLGFGASNITRSATKSEKINKLMTPEQLRLYRESCTDARIAAESDANNAFTKLKAARNPRERENLEWLAYDAVAIERKALRSEQEALNAEAEGIALTALSSDWHALKDYGTTLRVQRRAERRAYREQQGLKNEDSDSDSESFLPGIAKKFWTTLVGRSRLDELAHSKKIDADDSKKAS